MNTWTYVYTVQYCYTVFWMYFVFILFCSNLQHTEHQSMQAVTSGREEMRRLDERLRSTIGRVSHFWAILL